MSIDTVYKTIHLYISFIVLLLLASVVLLFIHLFSSYKLLHIVKATVIVFPIFVHLQAN